MLLRFDAEYGPFRDQGGHKDQWDLSAWWDKADLHGNYPTAYFPTGGVLRWVVWSSAVKTPGVHEALVCLMASVGTTPPQVIVPAHHCGYHEPSGRGPFQAVFGEGLPLEPKTVLWLYVNGYGPPAFTAFGGAPVEVQAVAWADGNGIVPHWHGDPAPA